MKSRSWIALMLLVAVIATLGVGCATKKYVRETLSPVEKRVDTLDKKTGDQAASIAELEKGVSRADERAQGADSRAGAAGREAARANEQAALANKEAADARSLAEKGIARAGEVDSSLKSFSTRIDSKVENMDNFRLLSTETVLFDLSSSNLNDDAKKLLDTVASKIAAQRHYVIEVQGFTDSTGSPEANIELSQRRAAAVVRYLTGEGKIPLFRVNTVGYGESIPAADNKTRDGRKLNRRVEVRIYTAG